MRLRSAARPLVGVGLVLIAIAGPRAGAPIRADTGRATDAQSGAGGVTVEILRWNGEQHVRVSGDGGGEAGCDWSIDPIADDWVGGDAVGPGPRRSGMVLGLLSCDGVAQRLVYYDPNAVVDVDAEARRVAERFVATVPVPRPTLVADPLSGLAGVVSTFALEGAALEPITATLEAFGIAVDVRILPTPVAWSFGDGTSTIAGAGPHRHLYTERSTGNGADATFAVAAAYRLEPAYRVDRASWLPLDPIPVRADRAYLVREAQAVIG